MSVRIYGNQALPVTPFKENGEFDEYSYQNLLNFIMRGEVNGILALGTTGEFFSLGLDEWKHIVDVTMNIVKGELPIGIGCGHAGTDQIVKMGRYAADAGANYLLVTPPYYFPNTSESILQSYGEVAESVGIDLMLYDGGGGVEITVENLISLAQEFENVKYVKLFTQNVEKVAKVREMSQGHITPIAGHSHVFYLQLLYGADGMTTAASNIFPRENTLIFANIKAGKYDEARDIHNRIMAPWNDICFPNPFQWIQCYKKALEWKGVIKSSFVRLPLVQVDKVREKELYAVLKYVGFLS